MSGTFQMQIPVLAGVVDDLTQQQATAIAANQFLDDDSRKLAYIALQLEVSKEISGIYGEAWTTYEKYGGAWIANLAPARAAK